VKYSAVVIPDLHYPFHDKKFVSITEKVVKLVQPEYLVQIGDALDFFQISTYPKSPERRNTIYEDMLLYSEQIDRWVKCGGDRLKYFYQLEGNHCARMHRFISTKAPEIFQIIKSVPDVLRFPERNRVGKVRFKWFPYDRWDACKLGDLVLHHGENYGKNLATDNLREYPTKFIQGHSHRFQSASNGTIWSVSLGHGSDTEKTMHKSKPSTWQQAIGIVTVVDGKAHLEPILVNNGKAVFRGEAL